MPGLSGVKGNEEADGLAKEATTEDRDMRIKVPARNCRSIKKEEMFQRTTDRGGREV